jgi:hypothetical protein
MSPTLGAVGAAAVLLAASPAARGDPMRILVAVGHQRGAQGERPLRYPIADAAGLARVMQTLGGVAAEHVVLLDDPGPASLDEGLARAERLARGHPPDQVTLFFYFSGHGDRGALHLGPASLAVNDLAARLARIPAQLRVVILDACRTTRRAQPKGVTAEPAFAIALAPPAPAVGTVWIQASSDGETAQESEDLGGAVFTHYLLSGLRGAADSDGDQRVTLSEAYEFAYTHTLLRTSPGTAQRPTATLDLLETGPIVLTDITARAGAPLAWLRLPGERDVRYLVFGRRSQTIVGELWSRDRPTDLALSPGSYLVQRRAVAGGGGAAEVQLSLGDRRSLTAGDFRPVAEEVLAEKGGELRLRPHEIEVGGGVAIGNGARLFAGYAFEGGPWAAAAELEAATSGRTTPANQVRERWLGGTLRLERRWSRDRWRLRLGVGPALQWVEQRVQRLDADRVTLAGYPPERQFNALAAGGALLVGLRRELTPWLWVELGVRGSGLVARSHDGLQLRQDTSAAAGAGLAF